MGPTRRRGGPGRSQARRRDARSDLRTIMASRVRPRLNCSARNRRSPFVATFFVGAFLVAAFFIADFARDRFGGRECDVTIDAYADEAYFAFRNSHASRLDQTQHCRFAPFQEKTNSSPPCTFNVLPDVTLKHRGCHPLTVHRQMETPRFWGVSISGFRLVLGALLGHLGAFLALRLSGGLRRRSYLLLARHLGFGPVSRRGLSGRWHDVLLISRAVMALPQ